MIVSNGGSLPLKERCFLLFSSQEVAASCSLFHLKEVLAFPEDGETEGKAEQAFHRHL